MAFLKIISFFNEYLWLAIQFSSAKNGKLLNLSYYKNIIIGELVFFSTN